jgi:hypothetical protein
MTVEDMADPRQREPPTSCSSRDAGHRLSGSARPRQKAAHHAVVPSPAACRANAPVVQRRSDGAGRGRTRRLNLPHDGQHVGGEGVRGLAVYRYALGPRFGQISGSPARRRGPFSALARRGSGRQSEPALSPAVPGACSFMTGTGAPSRQMPPSQTPTPLASCRLMVSRSPNRGRTRNGPCKRRASLGARCPPQICGGTG